MNGVIRLIQGMVVVGLALFLIAGTPIGAFEMEGANTRLRIGTLNVGGGAPASVGGSGIRLNASIGQKQPVGTSTGASGSGLHAGFWHAVPEPAAVTGQAAGVLAMACLARRRRRLSS